MNAKKAVSSANLKNVVGTYGKAFIWCAVMVIASKLFGFFVLAPILAIFISWFAWQKIMRTKVSSKQGRFLKIYDNLSYRRLGRDNLEIIFNDEIYFIPGELCTNGLVLYSAGIKKCTDEGKVKVEPSQKLLIARELEKSKWFIVE